MRHLVYKILFSIQLFASNLIFAQNTTLNGGFEMPLTQGNYSFSKGNPYDMTCFSDEIVDQFVPITLSSIPVNDYTSNVSRTQFIPDPNTQYDHTLYNLNPRIQLLRYLGGQNAIKLNPKNSEFDDAASNSTVLMKSLSNIDGDYLSINYAMLFRNPDAEDFLVARFDILNSQGETVNTQCIYSEDEIFQVATDSWYYTNGWKCINLDVRPLVESNEQGVLRIIINDVDKFNDSIMYVDDIGNNGILCDEGVIIENPLPVVSLDQNQYIIDCDTESITISGTYTLNDESNENMYVDLFISDGSLGNTLFASGVFTNGLFSFIINNPAAIFNNSTIYNISVVATYAFDDTELTAQIDGSPDIIFQECNLPCDPITNIAVNGAILSWASLDTNFELEFISDGTCCENENGIHTPFTYSTSNLNIDLDIVASALHAKCFRFRIQSNCSDWTNWCCLVNVGSDTQLTTDCIPSNPCESYDPDPMLLSPTDDILNGTTINYDTFTAITASNVVENGASSLYRANNFISLVPGFKARYGSSFHAQVIPCNPTIEPPRSQRNMRDNLEDLKVFPNPATNELTIATKMNKLNSLLVYDLYGNLLNKLEKLNSYNYNLDVNGYSRGYLILKITLEDGSVIYKNIILK
ncbi:MAG: T9SS type A sorting domain-containing protein [Gelidibacter sp.]